MHLIFQTEDSEWALPLLRVKEVVKCPEVTKVPFVSEKLLGVMNLRGEIISIIDESSAQGPESAVIVVDHSEYRLGILVDKVLEVRGELGSAKFFDLTEVLKVWTDSI